MLRGGFTWETVGVRRLVGALLLLFVFSLPLHFHAADESRQLSHECSCLHGARTQLASIPASAILATAPAVYFVMAERAESLVSLAVDSDSARAPPLSL